MKIFQKTLEMFAQNKKNGETPNANGKLSFKLTKQEIKRMPENIKKVFIANNFIVNYRITSNGYYEARMRRKNIYIEASGRDFETMRTRFMQRLEAYFNQDFVYNRKDPAAPIPMANTTKFSVYAEEWLNIKEQTTKPSTYKEYLRTYTVDIKPYFEKQHIGEITRSQLQKFLFEIVKEGKHRKAEKIALMLNCIFEMAAEDFGIRSPMKNVVLPYYQSKKGKAFTREEEERLVKYCLSHKNLEGTDALLVLLYFGLRKSELKSIKIIDNQWLQCETSKERMGQDVVLRKIPFTPMAKKVIPYIDFKKAAASNINTVATRLKRLFPDHHAHELRDTFITRCKECGVHPEIVMMWGGHCEDKDVLASRVNRGYTDFSDSFQLKEAEKVLY